MPKLLRLRGLIVNERTRKQKREMEKKINFFGEFSKITKHFFKDLNKKLANVKDERNQSYITYAPELILFTVIMKNVSGIVSMNKKQQEIYFLNIQKIKREVKRI